MLKAYTARRNAFIGALQRIDGVDARFPEGAFYAWVRIRKNNFDDLALCDYLLNEAGVAGRARHRFGGGGEQCVRVLLRLLYGGAGEGRPNGLPVPSKSCKASVIRTEI